MCWPAFAVSFIRPLDAPELGRRFGGAAAARRRRPRATVLPKVHLTVHSLAVACPAAGIEQKMNDEQHLKVRRPPAENPARAGRARVSS